MATLYVMVGLPGSGKSTWAKKNLVNADYISRDTVRLSIIKDNEHLFSHEDEVYDKFIDNIVGLLRRNRDVVADATHLSHGARHKLVSALAKHEMTGDKYDIVFVMMDTPVTECVRRDETREGRAHVTEPVIRNMYRSLSTPYVGEFNNVKEVWIVRGC